MPVVHASQKGPIRVVVEASEGAIAFFNEKDRAKIIKRGMLRAGWVWAKKWMPLRFTRYAFKLGYRVSRRWARLKESKTGTRAMPFVGLTPVGGGDMSEKGHWSQRNKAKMLPTATGKVRVTARGGRGSEEVNIAVPYGHAIQTQHSKWFKTIPSNEMDDMANAVAKRIADEISRGAEAAARKTNEDVREAKAISREQKRMARAQAVAGRGAVRLSKSIRSDQLEERRNQRRLAKTLRRIIKRGNTRGVG